MDADFWHKCWAEGNTGWDQTTANQFLIQFWPELNLPANSQVFVPLCGKSEDMNWLVQAGHQILGVELDESAVIRFFDLQNEKPTIRREENFTRYQSGNIQILVGDIFKLTDQHLENVQAVYDRAALIALPPKMRQDYAEFLIARIPTQAKTLLVTFEKVDKDPSGPPFSVDQQEVERLFDQAFSIELLDDQPFDPAGLNFRELAFRLSRN